MIWYILSRPRIVLITMVMMRYLFHPCSFPEKAAGSTYATAVHAVAPVMPNTTPISVTTTLTANADPIMHTVSGA